MSSFPLTNSIIFQDGYRTTNQLDSTRFGVTWAVTAGKETTFEHAAALADTVSPVSLINLLYMVVLFIIITGTAPPK